MSVFAVSFFSGPYEERGPVDLLFLSPAGQNLELSSGGEPVTGIKTNTNLNSCKSQQPSLSFSSQAEASFAFITTIQIAFGYQLLLL